MTCTHHKKLNIEIPSWLWFGIFPAGMKFTEQERIEGEKIALRIKESFKDFMVFHGYTKGMIEKIVEPNRHDALPRCDKCLQG
jgi:hypothetical protein